jgi:hypothetical protein
MQMDAAADHTASLALFRERFGITPTSLVFPKNQVAFLAHYRAQGISDWRDNESPWYYRLTRHTNHPVVRGPRMMDAPRDVQTGPRLSSTPGFLPPRHALASQ